MENQNGKRPTLEIHVTGVSKLSQRAELCVMSVKVTSSGEKQATVSTNVTTTGNRLHKLFKELALKTESGHPTADAPVTRLSVGQLTNSSVVPRDNNNSKTLPRVYSASLFFDATFRDFVKLNEIGSILLTIPHVEIQRTEWKLTNETMNHLGTEARQLALRNAIQKAEDYAQVLGRSVIPVELRDSTSSPHHKGDVRTRMAAYAYPVDDSDWGIALEPEDVQVAASISVKFATVE